MDWILTHSPLSVAFTRDDGVYCLVFILDDWKTQGVVMDPNEITGGYFGLPENWTLA